jgi:hypothetical protein
VPTIDEILVASRLEPDPEWVDGLETRLFPPARRAPQRRRFALAFVGGLASVALALSLVRDAGPVDAEDSCRYVSVTRVERVPFVVSDAAGRPAITYRDRSVTRRELRCVPPPAAGGQERAR